MGTNAGRTAGTEIVMGLRPGAPDDGQAMWRSEGKENRARRKQWDKQEHYLQVEQPLGPITFRTGDVGDRKGGLVIASGPHVPTVELVERAWMAKRADVPGIRIDGVPGAVQHPRGLGRRRRRYDVTVGHRHWRAERHRFGRVVLRRVDLDADRHVEVVGLGVAARLSALLRPTGLGVPDRLVASDAEPVDVAVLVALRFVGWSSLWLVRAPGHAGTRLQHSLWGGRNDRAGPPD